VGLVQHLASAGIQVLSERLDSRVTARHPASQVTADHKVRLGSRVTAQHLGSLVIAGSQARPVFQVIQACRVHPVSRVTQVL